MSLGVCNFKMLETLKEKIEKRREIEISSLTTELIRTITPDTSEGAPMSSSVYLSEYSNWLHPFCVTGESVCSS